MYEQNHHFPYDAVFQAPKGAFETAHGDCYFLLVGLLEGPSLFFNPRVLVNKKSIDGVGEGAGDGESTGEGDGTGGRRRGWGR